MPRNPNLVPTVITDVNGKTTTVHKKPDKPSLSARLPAPGLSNQPPSPAKVIELMEQINGPMSDRKRHDTRSYLRNGFNQGSLEVITRALTMGGEISKGVVSHLLHEDADSFIVNTLIYYHRLGIKDYRRVTKLVASISHYRDLSEIDTADSERAYVDIMTLTHLIDEKIDLPNNDPSHPLQYDYYTDEGWGTATIKDAALIQSLIKEPQDLQALAETIVKYGVTAPNAIRGIQQGILPSLADGSL